MSSRRPNLLEALLSIQKIEKNPGVKHAMEPKDGADEFSALRIGAGKDQDDLMEAPDLRIGSLNVNTVNRRHSSDHVAAGSAQQQRFEATSLYPLLPGRLSFTVHDSEEQSALEIAKHPLLFFFSTDMQERYRPFCSDFGPVDLGTLVQFCDYMRDKEQDERLKGRNLVYYCSNNVEDISNTAFLLSAYLLLQHGKSPKEAIQPFSDVIGIPIVPFRDATHVKSTFELTLLDCLRALKKATDLQWFDLDGFDLAQYEHLEQREQGEMHVICPKFVAFPAPADLTEAETVIENFRQLGVSKVVRLNETVAYSHRQFEAAGLQHCDLVFPDCSTPSDQLVARFFAECDGKDRIAVHCFAGLGRTGTMIGLWLMRRRGFTAREAIAWMRIVRPGCVIGPQQHYLEWMEGRFRCGTFPGSETSGRRPQAPSSPSGAAPAMGLASQLASQLRRAVRNRRFGS